MSKISIERFSKEAEIYMCLTSLVGSGVIFLIWRDLILSISFLAGAVLGFLNFRIIKKEVAGIVYKLLRDELHYSKASLLYVIKFFVRFTIIALILYFLLVELKLNVILLLLGFSMIYLQLIMISVKNFLKNKVIIN